MMEYSPNRKRVRRSSKDETPKLSSSSLVVTSTANASIHTSSTNINTSTSTAHNKLNLLSSQCMTFSSQSKLDFLNSEVSSLKAEIERLQSLRRLDQIKCENTENRLKRHVVSLEADAKEARDLAQHVKDASESVIQQMTQTLKDKDGIMEKYRRQLEAQSLIVAVDGDAQVLAETLKEENLILKKKNDFLEQKIIDMNDEFMAMTASKHNNNNNHGNMDSSSPDNAASNNPENTNDNSIADNSNNNNHNDINDDGTPQKQKQSIIAPNITNTYQTHISPSSPAIISELNRLRVKLADAERINRQLSRKNDELQAKADQTVHYREVSKHAESNVLKLEAELKSLRKEREGLRVLEKRWTDFRHELKHAFPSTSTTASSSSSSSSSNNNNNNNNNSIDENTPPEIATIVRHFRLLKEKIQKNEDLLHKTQSMLDSAQRKIHSQEQSNTQLLQQIDTCTLKVSTLEKSNAQLLVDNKTIHAQEKVWKQEVDGLQLLLKSYQDIEEKMVSSSTQSTTATATTTSLPPSSNSHASIDGLQLSLQSARDELQILQQRCDELTLQNQTLEQTHNTLQEEHESVRTKFGKLRDALYAERQKVEQAEERAIQAETLAGKGCFNTETSRVLHFQDNPLSNAIRRKYESEIQNLQSILEEKESELAAALLNASNTTTTTTTNTNTNTNTITKGSKNNMSTLDAQKLNQRLKESFREQIALFREGVYLITGYKIDMNIENTDNRPHFIVRSMYAEREEDYLIFVWPEGFSTTKTKNNDVGYPQTLDIMDSDMAQVLSKDPTLFQYMKKYNSIPAFMASVCLNLFERQTFV